MTRRGAAARLALLACGSLAERWGENEVLGALFLVLRWCSEVLVFGSSCSGSVV